jgi:histone H3/H4
MAETKKMDTSSSSSSTAPAAASVASTATPAKTADEIKEGKIKKFRRPPFNGKPGPRGGKGRTRKHKVPKLPSFYVDNIPNQSLTKLARRAECGRLSKSGKLWMANGWVQFGLHLMKYSLKFATAAGRRKTIEFGDVAQAIKYFPDIRHILLPNKNYNPDAQVNKRKKGSKRNSSKTKKEKE